jgi:hypothetical protein
VSELPNPPAFPRTYSDTDLHCATIIGGEDGMSLRDWFAGQLAPLCFDQHHGNDWGQAGVKHASISAEKAYAWADALLAERTKGGAA